MEHPIKRSTNTRYHKGWNQLDPNWLAATTTTDKVKSGELVLPRPPNKPGGPLGIKLKGILLASCAAYIICKVKRCYIRRKKSNESLYKESIADSKNQHTTPDTNTGELKRPTLQDDQRITASETKEKRTVTSTDIKRGIVEIDWVNTRHGLDSDGMMNATIGEIQKAIEDDFNENMRRARRRSQPQRRMVVKPQTRLPQKRRTVRISEKWTKPTRTRLSPPSKQMD